MFYGKTGRGKTHLATALGMSAIDRGHERTLPAHRRARPSAGPRQARGNPRDHAQGHRQSRPDHPGTGSATCPSTSTAPDCSTRSSPAATREGASSSPRTSSSANGARSSPTTNSPASIIDRIVPPRTTHRVHRTKPPHQPGTHVRQTPKPINTPGRHTHAPNRKKYLTKTETPNLTKNRTGVDKHGALRRRRGRVPRIEGPIRVSAGQGRARDGCLGEGDSRDHARGRAGRPCPRTAALQLVRGRGHARAGQSGRQGFQPLPRRT